MSTPASRTRVVVIGAGYAGAVAANHLRLRDDVDIIVVNPRADFVERVRLHQLASGTADATLPLSTLLAHGIRLIVDSVTRIDTDARALRLASGRDLAYDYAIYAVGSLTTIPSSVPGAREFAMPIGDFDSARALRARIDRLPQAAPITVVGAGLTGIETAAELADGGHTVTLACGGILAPALANGPRRYIAKWLRRHGVTVRQEQHVTAVSTDTVSYSDGTVRAAAVTVWAAGFTAPHLATNSGLSTDALGRILTDETLTSVGDQRIIATGDAASPSGMPYRMSCQAAGPLGQQAADTVLSRIAGETPKSIDLALTGSCISLGRCAAVRQFDHKDDSPMHLYTTGPLTAAYKEFTGRLGVWKIRREARKPGSVPWPKGAPRPTESPTAALVTGAATSLAASVPMEHPWPWK
ncbi:FAD-dependent oxidoreductase [Humibacter antri]